MNAPQFPEAWRAAVAKWAEETPLVTEVFLFGSRAKGCARSDSDIDLAYRTKANGTDTPYTVAFFHGREWQRQIQALLPVPVDLQHADPAEDEIVWPAVQEHGIKIT